MLEGDGFIRVELARIHLVLWLQLAGQEGLLSACTEATMNPSIPLPLSRYMKHSFSLKSLTFLHVKVLIYPCFGINKKKKKNRTEVC